MGEECCVPVKNLIFSCSGASNVGQIANQAAVDLQQEGIGKMLCIAGIGAHVSGMIASAKAEERLVAIDGCLVACTRKALEHTDLAVTDHIVITELGVKKISHSGTIDSNILEKVTAEVKTKVSQAR